MVTRDWPKEPWSGAEARRSGAVVHGSVVDAGGELVAQTAGAGANRLAECVNAMKGWSAPEGAVDALLDAFYAVFDPEDLDEDDWDRLAAAAASFSRVQEPS